MESVSRATSTIGLFGTCGGSVWRNAFMAKYQELGIPFYNPQVENWTPECADSEAWHLANDELILFPITDETFAAGSLAETGFSVLSALNWTVSRFVVIYVAPGVSDTLMQQSPDEAKNSVRARKLVLAHLAQQTCANVFVVDSLEEMLEVSLRLFAAQAMLRSARKNASPTWRAALPPQFWLQALDPALAAATTASELAVA